MNITSAENAMPDCFSSSVVVSIYAEKATMFRFGLTQRKTETEY